MTKRQCAIANVKDLAINLLYYDRKDDEDLSVDDMADLLTSGKLTVKQIVSTFETALKFRIREMELEER